MTDTQLLDKAIEKLGARLGIEEGMRARIATLEQNLRIANLDYERLNTLSAAQDKALESYGNRIAALESDIAELRAFARDVWACHTGSLEGPDIEHSAIEHGLVQVVEVTAPCGEECECAALGNLPGQCYRPTARLKGAE